MNIMRLSVFVALIVAGIWWLANGPSGVIHADEGKSRPLAYIVDIDGTVNPALGDHILKSIEEAENHNADVVVIRVDTPGGLVTSTKTIIKGMINSSVPVVVFVGPSGSSATSAGALITVCADVAAMAPGTNIGAAHPVGGGGEEINETMTEKILNDLTAYIRGIVKQKGRNADWAEKAIRESVSVTAKEALEIKAIDVMADSVTDLLNKIDGRKINKKGKELTLHTKGARQKQVASGWRFKVLDVVANPNIAYLLMMAGMLGLMMEIYHPGLIFPGVLGGICLLLALFALQVLPVNHVGILLIILSIVLFVMEVKITSFGLLSIAGIISMAMGSIMLFETADSALRVSWYVIVPTVGCFSAFFIVAVSLVMKAWRKKPRTGEQGLMGEIGKAVSDILEDGKVDIHGEIWNARSDSLIPKGERIRVIKVDKLLVYVTRD
jgi:membrane-bound serine protease (ClpP class)